MEKIKTQISPVPSLMTEGYKRYTLINCTGKGLHWSVIHPDQNTVSVDFF